MIGEEISYQAIAGLARTIVHRHCAAILAPEGPEEHILGVNMLREMRSLLKDCQSLSTTEALTGVTGGEEVTGLTDAELERMVEPDASTAPFGEYPTGFGAPDNNPSDFGQKPAG